MSSRSVNAAEAVVALARNGWVPLVKPPRLKDIDLPRLGHRIGVGEDEIHAILDVEAPGGGYDKYGRLTILYEPHVAYRNASGGTRTQLVRAGLAYKSWGEKPYPSDSYSRFSAAYKIDPEVAIKASSLGKAQVLGENWASCGYESPQDMYATLANGGEAAHIECMIRFLIANHLDDDLREHSWVSLARGYNGPKHAKHNYAGRLKARFEWWSKKPDTPWSPRDEEVEVVALDSTQLGAAPPVVAPNDVSATVHAPSIGAVVTVPVIPTEAHIQGTQAGSITTPAVVVPKSWWRRLAVIIDDIFYTR